MMYKHTLNDIEIDEPTGFANVVIGPVRDPDYHGVGFEATSTSLVFTGNGYDILYTANETTGLLSKVIYASYSRCDELQEWELIFSGRINFGSLKKKCGITCSISAPIETSSCEVVLASRFNQQVDVDKGTGVDNTTALQHYDEMGKRITLHAKKVSTGLDVQVIDTGDVVEQTFVLQNTVSAMYRPDYEVIRLNSINTGHPDSQSYFIRENDSLSLPISPQIQLDDFVTKCFDGGFNYSFRMKGSWRFQYSGPGGSTGNFVYGKVTVLDWDGVTGNIFSNGTVIQEVDIVGGSPLIPSGSYRTEAFDQTLSGIYNLEDGHGLYAVMNFRFQTSAINTATFILGGFTFDRETTAFVTAEKNCPDTDTDYYMIHETLSHVTEEITNGCLRVKSNYYGRTDSQPYEFPTLGCGGLRMLTSGLKIRNAENATFFCSLKQLIDGLKAIDNIGFDVYGNDMRVEDVSFFYQDKELLSCPAANDVDITVNEDGHYAKITAGYQKWQVEQINGLDEFNSEREYKTSIETISNELNIQSILVAGSYPIEVTREQSFAETGAADTTYDNEIFLICLQRSIYPYSAFEVEQGNVTNPMNMYSPETAYNWRIRPIANMMRWFKSLASSYRNTMDPIAKVFFSSGTGNILAGGIMTDTFCRPELFDTIENQDITYGQVQNFTPLWINEIITFSYPLSLRDYNKIKDNPYGYVSVQCGEGQWLKGYINQLNWSVVKGIANFTLKRKA